MAEDLIFDINDDNFKETIKEGIILVDFFAEWCGPCRMLSPVLQEVAKELKDQVKFLKLNIDNNPETAKEYLVTSVPTLILFKEGNEANRIIGLRDAAAIKNFALSK